MSEMDKYQCPECSYIYDEDEGDARQGYDSGTLWEDIDTEFFCPDCGIMEKNDFMKVA
jgi:rubredoxin